MPGKFHIFLVTLQMASIALILVTGPLFPSSVLLAVIFTVSILFGIWAVAMMKFRVNVFPDLMSNSKFITSGPYSIVRHPMYTSVLFSSLCLVIDEFSLLRLIFWTVLLAVILKKSSIEDKILRMNFDEFDNYEQNTSRLIPYIF